MAILRYNIGNFNVCALGILVDPVVLEVPETEHIVYVRGNIKIKMRYYIYICYGFPEGFLLLSSLNCCKRKRKFIQWQVEETTTFLGKDCWTGRTEFTVWSSVVELVEPKLFWDLWDEPEPKINFNKHFLLSVWRMLGWRKVN